MTAHISTWWHDAYIAAARTAFPAITDGHELVVGWKLARPDGTTTNGYYWPTVDGDHDLPVLHEATDWDADNRKSCPARDGDGLCLVTTSAREASSGGIILSEGVGHVLVYPVGLACTDTVGKFRVPWCVDVDCFDPVALIRLGLSGADLSGADLYGADLSGATLSWADLYGANLSGANLTRATLYGANLTGADLTGANLSRATLTGATLSRATLSGANLSGATLSGANLSGANLTGANHDQWTRWPAGFTPPTVTP